VLDSGCRQHMTSDARMFNSINTNGNDGYNSITFGDNVMRTSPRWTHRCYGLSQVAICSQLSYHATLGFSRHVITVLVITLSYDIKTGCSWMRWKGDDDAIVLDLVSALEGPWIILCDHVKVLRHLFGPTWPCIMSGLKPKLWTPNPWPFPTLGRVLDYKYSRRRC
jgi:hypothetical protein